MFIVPIHEALDTKFLRLEKNMFTKENLVCRFFLRALVFGVNTFITAMFPFMGDFVNLIGSFTLFPLSFVFPSMIFLKVRASKFCSSLFLELSRQSEVRFYYYFSLLQVKGNIASRGEKAWHWANIVIFSLLSIITTASAIRLIINNVQIYKFFANT